MLTPSYAAYLLEWAAERGVDLRGSSVERVLVAGEPGGGEPAFRAQARGRAGARRSPRRWGSATSASRSGASARQQDGMHLGARGFVHAELIDPESGDADRARRRRHRRARADPPPPPRGAAAAVPHPRPRRGADEPVRVRPHRPRDPLHRADRRHADRPRRQRLPLGGARGRRRLRARGERPHPRPPDGAGRQAGAAAPGQRRARPGRGAPTPELAERDRATTAQRARRADARRARAVGEPAAQRVQVEARRYQAGG